MDYRSVMELPMRVFWHLSGFVPRLLADEHKQLLEVSTASQNPEASQKLHDALHGLSPEPVKLSAHAIVAAAELDRDGLESLRAMQGAPRQNTPRK